MIDGIRKSLAAAFRRARDVLRGHHENVSPHNKIATPPSFFPRPPGPAVNKGSPLAKCGGLPRINM